MGVAMTGNHVDQERVEDIYQPAHLHLVWEDGVQSESFAHRHRSPSSWGRHSHEVALPSGETIYTVGYRREEVSTLQWDQVFGNRGLAVNEEGLASRPLAAMPGKVWHEARQEWVRPIPFTGSVVSVTENF